jgi:hypothetical protein
MAAANYSARNACVGSIRVARRAGSHAAATVIEATAPIAMAMAAGSSAHAVAGPSNAFKAAEDTVRKWVFQPYLVLGEPVEVESKVQLQNN